MFFGGLMILFSFLIVNLMLLMIGMWVVLFLLSFDGLMLMCIIFVCFVNVFSLFVM